MDPSTHKFDAHPDSRLSAVSSRYHGRDIAGRNEWLSSACHVPEQPDEAEEFHGRWKIDDIHSYRLFLQYLSPWRLLTHRRAVFRRFLFCWKIVVEVNTIYLIGGDLLDGLVYTVSHLL